MFDFGSRLTTEGIARVHRIDTLCFINIRVGEVPPLRKRGWKE
jgi:hypothetical protein